MLENIQLPDDATTETEAKKIAARVTEGSLRNYLRALYLDQMVPIQANLLPAEQSLQRRLGALAQQASDGLTQIAHRLAAEPSLARRRGLVRQMMTGVMLAAGDSIEQLQGSLGPLTDPTQIRQALDQYSQPASVALMKRNLGGQSCQPL